MSSRPEAQSGAAFCPPQARLDLSSAHLDIVREILRRHLPKLEVRAFGSRATGRAKPFSDLDLFVVSAEPLQPWLAALVAESFSESDLPFKVDVVDGSLAAPSFREHVLLHSIPVQAASP
jgi:predicted nucleotidyltransferase